MCFSLLILLLLIIVIVMWHVRWQPLYNVCFVLFVYIYIHIYSNIFFPLQTWSKSPNCPREGESMDVMKSKEHQTHHTSTYCTHYAVPTKDNAFVIYSSTCVPQYHDSIISVCSIEHDLVHWDSKQLFRFMWSMGSFHYTMVVLASDFGENPKNTSSKSQS